MRKGLMLFVLIFGIELALAVSGNANFGKVGPENVQKRTEAINRFDEALDLLCTSSEKGYNCDTVIKVILAAEVIGKQESVARLRRRCADGRDIREQLFVLCRLLFVASDGMELRRARIGAALFLGDTDYSSWPMEPVEVVDGVPFLITRGYTITGVSESGADYLDYCVKDGIWSPRLTTAKTPVEMRRALGTLLSSKEWRRELADSEKEFLHKQVP